MADAEYTVAIARKLSRLPRDRTGAKRVAAYARIRGAEVNDVGNVATDATGEMAS